MNLSELLQPIRERLAKATPGPWVDDHIHDDDIASLTCNGHIVEGNNCGIAITVDRGTGFDSELIAHAPTDIARLLAALEVADAALAQVKFSRGSDAGSVNANNYNTAADARAEIAAILSGGVE